jgi:hypothetical protein
MVVHTVQFKQSRDGGSETEIELRFPWGLNSSTPVGPITGPSTATDPNSGQAPAAVEPGMSIPPIP